ncbi:MAG: hypothetical protein JWP45_2753 [Mucilaginibacter sp.]|nr:hypothetical protein [Mucilaginibacter sp.]
MLDDEGNGVNLTYNVEPTRYSTNPVSLYMPGATTATLQYEISQGVTPYVLSQVAGNYDIDNPSDILTFTWITNTNYQYDTGQTFISSISGAVRNWNFQYQSLTFTTRQNVNYTRYFLQGYSQSLQGQSNPTCSSPVNYQFAYNGVNFTAGTTTLPDSSTVKVDYWSYLANNSNPYQCI